MHEVAGKRLEFRLALAHAARIQGGERGAVIGEIATDGLEAIFARMLLLHVLPKDLEAGSLLASDPELMLRRDSRHPSAR